MNQLAQPRFLICRLSAVGDTVHTLPLAVAIKERWPKAWVAWVVERGASPFVQHHPAVDATIIAPKGFMKSPKLAWQLRSELKRQRIEIALDPQSLTKSALCGWLSGAQQRIGFAKPHGRELAPWLNTVNCVAKERHVVNRYLELLTPLQAKLLRERIRFDLPCIAPAAQAMQKWLECQGVQRPFAVINPGAGWDSKIWPCERYAAVAKELSIPSVVVWAGDKEHAWAEQIVSASQQRATLAPATSLLELMELVRKARLFIGSDTGPLHIAAAVGTPCVSIYGPTQPEVCGPFGAGHVVLQTSYEELGSSRKNAGMVSQAMLEVTVLQVSQACEHLLASEAMNKNAA